MTSFLLLRSPSLGSSGLGMRVAGLCLNPSVTRRIYKVGIHVFNKIQEKTTALTGSIISRDKTIIAS